MYNMNKIRENFFCVISILLCLLLFCVKITGEAVHVAAGCILVFISVRHFCKNLKRIKYVPPKLRIADWLLAGSLIGLAVSGMLMHLIAGVFAVKIVHKLFAVLFCIGMLVHALQHSRIRKEREKNVS